MLARGLAPPRAPLATALARLEVDTTRPRRLAVDAHPTWPRQRGGPRRVEGLALAGRPLAGRLGMPGAAGVEGALTDAAGIGHGFASTGLLPALATASLRREPPWAALGRLGQELACDLTVETIRLKGPYVLLFIQFSTRRVVLAGSQPTLIRHGRASRQGILAMDLNEQELPARFLLRDHEAKFTRSFD